jgi:hypothetical protein
LPEPAGIGLAPQSFAKADSERTRSVLSPAVRSISEAISRLGLIDLPFLFFVDAATGRSSVLYHRYDGHYGLIVQGG